LLLDNAAIIHPNAPLWEVTPKAFSRVIELNLKATDLKNFRLMIVDW